MVGAIRQVPNTAQQKNTPTPGIRRWGCRGKGRIFKDLPPTVVLFCHSFLGQARKGILPNDLSRWKCFADVIKLPSHAFHNLSICYWDLIRTNQRKRNVENWDGTYNIFSGILNSCEAKWDSFGFAFLGILPFSIDCKVFTETWSCFAVYVRE